MSVPKDSPGMKLSNSKTGIKGFSLSSKSANSKSSQLKTAPLFGKRSRPSFTHDEDSESDRESDDKSIYQTVSGFDDGGAIQCKDEKKPGLLVIDRLKNKDWKSEIRARKKGKCLLTPEVIATSRGANIDESRKEVTNVINGNDVNLPIEWGLSFGKRRDNKENSLPTDEIKSQEDLAMNQKTDQTKLELESRNLDEEALQALMGNNKEAETSHLVISAKSFSPTPKLTSEYDAYKRAVAAAPEPSTLQDYERIPVEEFGAALLRGMGWNGQQVGRLKDVKPRQNLLGLGAKELKEAEELGAWVNKSDNKKLRSYSNKCESKDRKIKAGDYRRDEEKRRERREERGGGSYKKARDTNRDERKERLNSRHRGGWS